MIFVLIYLIDLYIRPQDWIPMFYGWPVDYFVIVPALIFGFMSLSNDKKKLVSMPQYRLLVAMLLIIFLSNVVNGDFAFGVDEFVLFLKKVCIFVLILLLLKSIKNMKYALFTMIAFSAFIAGQAIYQFFTGNAGLAGQDFYHSGTGVRTMWVGLWNGANIMALLLNVSLPFALEFTFGPYSGFWRLLNAIFAATLILGVYTTNSRGGFLTLLSILLMYPITKLKNKKRALIIGSIFAGAIFVFLSPTRTSEINTKEESANIRTQLWDKAMEMFKEKPLFGIGKGKFKQSTSRNLVTHSNFMQTLSETGGFGIFVWVSLIYFSYKGLLKVYNINAPPGSEEEKLKSIARALLISLTGFNVCTIFITMDIDLFYLLLGLCAVLINLANREVQSMSMRFYSKDVKNIFGIILGMLVFYHVFTR